MYSWRDRELVLDLFEEITGNRVNHGSNAIGGVRFDLTPKMKESVKNGVKTVRERTEYYINLALKEKTIAMRSVGVGLLSTDKANELCAVGPTLRASNVALDIRKNDPYGAYKEIPFNVIKHDTCDVFARVVVRLKELIESCNIIDYAVDNLPNGPLKINVPKRIPIGEYVSSVEAPRGELVYYVKSTGRDNPYRVKVRTPTLANITSIREAVLGENIADIPIIVAGIDPCFACQDRSLFIDTERNKRWIWTKEELRNYGIKWYKKQL